MTNLTPSATNLLATEMPCLGSETSSPIVTFICSPLMPPAALISATACSVPFWIWAPNAALGPVIGAPTPTRISAHAPPLNASRAVSATADKSDFFIDNAPIYEVDVDDCFHAMPTRYRRKNSLPILEALSRQFSLGHR